MIVKKKKISSKFEGLTKEEKRQLVISEGGRETLYLACPLCGFNRPLNKYTKGQIKLTNIDFDRFFVVVTRVGGGLGSGFFRIDEKSFRLKELKDMPEYRDILEQIAEQAQKILEILK